MNFKRIHEEQGHRQKPGHRHKQSCHLPAQAHELGIERTHRREKREGTHSHIAHIRLLADGNYYICTNAHTQCRTETARENPANATQHKQTMVRLCERVNILS